MYIDLNGQTCASNSPFNKDRVPHVGSQWNIHILVHSNEQMTSVKFLKWLENIWKVHACYKKINVLEIEFSTI